MPHVSYGPQLGSAPRASRISTRSRPPLLAFFDAECPGHRSYGKAALAQAATRQMVVRASVARHHSAMADAAAEWAAAAPAVVVVRALGSSHVRDRMLRLQRRQRGIHQLALLLLVHLRLVRSASSDLTSSSGFHSGPRKSASDLKRVLASVGPVVCPPSLVRHCTLLLLGSTTANTQAFLREKLRTDNPAP